MWLGPGTSRIYSVGPRQYLAIVYTPHCVSQVPEDVSFHLGSAVRADEDATLTIPEEALTDEAALNRAG